ncbi:MAG: hypothetical protein M1840_007836 [Geoglossum simile]|nr:MAG: hypothetical protein M1840_007836 [Geoglossum simile]
MYTTHPPSPKAPGDAPEYYMAQLRGWCMTNSVSVVLSIRRRAPNEVSPTELGKRPMQGRDILQKIYNIKAAKGTDLFDKYKAFERKINSLSIKLRRERLGKALRDFHDSIDTIEINKQLDGITAADILTQSTIQDELRERAIVAKLLSQPLDALNEERALKIHVKFIRNLARLYQLREVDNDEAKGLKGALRRKRKLSETDDEGVGKSPRLLKAAFDDAENVQDDDVRIIQNLYPMGFACPVCLICIGNEQLPYAERMRPFRRKYTLQRHLNTHLQQGVFDGGFEYKHVYYSERLQGIMQFIRMMYFISII